MTEKSTLSALWDHELDLQARVVKLESAVGVMVIAVVSLSVYAILIAWRLRDATATRSAAALQGSEAREREQSRMAEADKLDAVIRERDRLVVVYRDRAYPRTGPFATTTKGAISA
jgi:hypothetical protein